MKKPLIAISGILMLISASMYVSAQKPLPVIVDVEHPKAKIQSTMWGIFFEDINMAADGGIYAELVKNRSFEFFNPRTGWKVRTKCKDSSALIILNRNGKHSSNPRFARITVNPDPEGYCLTNYGFRGMGIKAGAGYDFSMLAAVPSGGEMDIRIELIDQSGNKMGGTTLKISGSEWKKYSVPLISERTDTRAKLNIWFESTGVVDADMISLFPQDTWKGRKGGLRADLVQLLADMKPGFIRFPGGCIVEGRELETRYQWKNTIGPVEERHLIVNRWNTEFSHRPTPDYFQSFGLGFYEYFLLAEDIGAEPLPVLSCGMACQFNTAEVVPLNQLDPYIQDALDLIEFANGPVSSEWGKKRAEMGHPEPFHMKMIGIGNEQWGPQYFERYRLFEKAVLAKYPDMKIILGAGPSSDGDLFDFAWNELHKIKPQIVDEHYYKDPQWFLKNVNRYDHYDRNGHKIFAGEYAAQSDYVCSPNNKNNWECALAEAAFMTGLERNADVVTMCSYAPLFGHADGWQWTPDLIWFDNLRSFGTPNYYVQQMFSTHKGTDVLDITAGNESLSGQDGLFATAAWDNEKKEIILKIVNVTDKPIIRNIELKTKKSLVPGAQLMYLQNKDIKAVNAFDDLTVKPAVEELQLKGHKLELSCPAYSLNIVSIKIQ